MVLADGYLIGHGGTPLTPRLLKLTPNNGSIYISPGKYAATFSSQNIDSLDILGLVIHVRAAGSTRGGMMALTGLNNGSKEFSMYGQTIVNYYEADAYGVARLTGGSTIEIDVSGLIAGGYSFAGIISVVFILKE